MNIKLSVKEKIKLLNADDVYSVMQKVLLREQKLDRDKEHFWLISLASNNRILNIELIAMGGVNAATVEPMNVFRIAVMKGSVAVIMVHNHPSGELNPTEADKDLTDRLIQVGRILDIRVFDHLIISVKSFMSFAETGLFHELEQSTKWVPQFELIQRIREEEKRIREEAVTLAVEKTLEKEKKKREKAVVGAKRKGKKDGIEEGTKKGIKEGKIEIAREMKKDNEPIEKIVRYTGLTRVEIGKIK